ncbi:MAG: hypothetical protein SGI98_10420 [Verrucomicrobiota bacterium]|nr:hypothetical protein [Verrucomicrobiota bacterium]
MKTTIDIPEVLYKRTKIRAIETGKSLRDIVLSSLEHELSRSALTAKIEQSALSHRKLLPEYEAILQAGAFSAGQNSTHMIGEDRDAR